MSNHPPGLCLDSGEFIPAEEVNRRMREVSESLKPITKSNCRWITGTSVFVVAILAGIFFSLKGCV